MGDRAAALRLGICLVLVCVGGCPAESRRFKPTGELGVTFEGARPGVYEPGSTLGTTARIQLQATAFRGHDRTVVQVVFTIGNNTGAVLHPTFTGLWLVAQASGRALGVPATSVPVDAFVAPLATRNFTLQFPLPPGVPPRDLRALRLYWTVKLGTLGSGHVTDFVPSE